MDIKQLSDWLGDSGGDVRLSCVGGVYLVKLHESYGVLSAVGVSRVGVEEAIQDAFRDLSSKRVEVTAEGWS